MSHASDLHWVKSSFSDAGGNNCVEVAAVEQERVAIRESDSPTAILMTNRAALGALVRELKLGDFTPPPA
ncbi:DUF397 domain-containing protein [Streptomyces sp. AK04-4c]|uniref:DUF397 domain-containing protein n=1 Tax=Streptomyces sp. AK04-4c TaxID=3028651 RepID=UPI0029B1E23D|nr:DUF397 domain-containing protein [Streptomyces sp. AK04-4c]MDX3683128.1 DUF397 domain-containing protein [Streptomyces sp. AK04-4c]